MDSALRDDLAERQTFDFLADDKFIRGVARGVLCLEVILEDDEFRDDP